MLRHRSAAHAVPHGASAVAGNLLDRELWDRLLPGVDAVFHLAAQTSARSSERDPSSDYRLNTEATSWMLDACRRSGKPIDVLFAGTTTQHGKPQRLPLTGREPDFPI